MAAVNGHVAVAKVLLQNGAVNDENIARQCTITQEGNAMTLLFVCFGMEIKNDRFYDCVAFFR